MNNSFSRKISEKEFVNEIKGCKTIDLKDFSKKIISEKTDNKTGIKTTILKIKGCFSITMKKIVRPSENKDSVLETILKKIKEIKVDITELKQDVSDIKTRVTNLEQDVAELKQDVSDIKTRVTNIEKCPTIKKELTDFN